MRTERVVLCVLLLLSVAASTTIGRVVTTTGPKKASSSAPIRFIYINGITDYFGVDLVPTALGVPGFTAGNVYNYVAHTFWTYPNTPLSASSIWSNLLDHFRNDTRYGSTLADAQKTMKSYFTNAGVKLLVSAFGATQQPTSLGFNATDCGLQIAKFVIDNSYDGVDIDWEDTKTFSSGDGLGENWLITLTTVLRENLPPGSIITHAPQAPYFGKGLYPMGGYLAV